MNRRLIALAALCSFAGACAGEQKPLLHKSSPHGRSVDAELDAIVDSAARADFKKHSVAAPPEFSGFLTRLSNAAPRRRGPLEPSSASFPLWKLHAVAVSVLDSPDLPQGTPTEMRVYLERYLPLCRLRAVRRIDLPVLSVGWDGAAPGDVGDVHVRLIETVFIERSGLRVNSAATWARDRSGVPFEKQWPVALELVDQFLDDFDAENPR